MESFTVQRYEIILKLLLSFSSKIQWVVEESDKFKLNNLNCRWFPWFSRYSAYPEYTWKASFRKHV